MAAYIIGAVLIIVVLFIIGSILRKRIYDAVDKLESWKISIMDRNVAAELAKIKPLNLLGETLERFEAWKERWDEILEQDLHEVEEQMYEAEQAADRYRIPSAKAIVHSAEQKLKAIEQEINKILEELGELLASEETSRKEASELEPELKALRRQLSQKRYQFGKAEAAFEKELDELFKALGTYKELADEGNYLEARALIDQVNAETAALLTKMETFPLLYKAQKHELPQAFDELRRGLREMREEGYRVDHFNFEQELNTYEKSLVQCAAMLDEGQVAKPEEIIADIRGRISEIYDILEREAIARNHVESKLPDIANIVETAAEDFAATKEEVDVMRRAYYFEDSDMERFLTLEKSVQQLIIQLQDLEMEMNGDTSHTDLRKELEELYEHVAVLESEHEAFKKRIINLRKDELEAKENVAELHEQINNLRRKLSKSNIPGVPNNILSLIEQAMAKNKLVMKALERHPLEIAGVQAALENAKQAFTHAAQEANLMIEQAHLTEKVIQYANRYRSQNDGLAMSLADAERLFRNCEYELALEKAAKAVELVEPGALKRIEQSYELMQ
ncbi:septation ring formation regulator EzrA [Aciduricibacillus chroicocephali]|uniref:Septation ring formation regulator EzrA n=1 Tax=Aciduricibacillus chroicocephali TaxID=3054939 RepID=A0ABY9KSJ5_9BACI|nr:septation ring formation regulator EzrA [Bacillaceae bacterium 44XB]